MDLTTAYRYNQNMMEYYTCKKVNISTYAYEYQLVISFGVNIYFIISKTIVDKRVLPTGQRRLSNEPAAICFVYFAIRVEVINITLKIK